MLYPIAEIFQSPQGEGRWAGTLMNFIRFAGCTVGKPYSADIYSAGLPIYTERCTTYDGRSFACDTDYRVKERLSADDIIKRLDPDIHFVLFTGGEPLMRDLNDLMLKIKDHFSRVEFHCETSGTIPVDMNKAQWRRLDWITVSPKFGFLDVYADTNLAKEFKILVDSKFVWETIPLSIRKRDSKISLCAINEEHSLNKTNMEKCVELQRAHPNVRLSLQAHKIWGVR